MSDKTCAERIDAEYESEMETLRELWEKYCEGTDDGMEELNEHGLSFDYCYASRGNPGYFRYQISWGGPSDEFRIYADRRGEYRWNIWKIEYWFMDWFDGAKKVLHGEDLKFMENLLTSFFAECGSFDHEYEKAMKNYEPEDDEDFDEEDEE